MDNRRLVKRGVRHANPAAVDESALVSFFPPQLAQIYNFPTDLDGTGQCIGLLEFGGGFDTNDLKTYFQQDLSGFGIAEPSIQAVSADGTQNDPNDPSIPPDRPRRRRGDARHRGRRRGRPGGQDRGLFLQLHGAGLGRSDHQGGARHQE